MERNEYDLVCRLLEEPLEHEGKVNFTENAVALIHAIANQIETTEIVQATKDKAQEYAKGLSAEEVYLDMLRKIVNAPTTIHMLMSARLLIPVIDQKIRERGM